MIISTKKLLFIFLVIERERQAEIERIKQEAFEEAKKEAEILAKQEAERLAAKLEAERQAKLEAERLAKQEAEIIAKQEALKREKEQKELERNLKEQMELKHQEELRKQKEAEMERQREVELKLKRLRDLEEQQEQERQQKLEQERKLKKEFNDNCDVMMEMGVDLDMIKAEKPRLYQRIKPMIDEKNYVQAAIHANHDIKNEKKRNRSSNLNDKSGDQNDVNHIDPLIVQFALENSRKVSNEVSTKALEHKDKVKCTIDEIASKNPDEIAQILAAKAISHQDVLKIPLHELDSLLDEDSVVAQNLLPNHDIKSFKKDLEKLISELEDLDHE